MRATQAIAFGGPEVLVPVEVPEPVVGPGQVLVAVAAVDTIYVETQVRSGWGRAFFPVVPPYVPGGGIAGTVRSTGEGVDPAWTGRRVVASIGSTGGYAELAVARAEALAVVPDGVSFTDAAALVHDGVTAARLLATTAVGPGEQVLIVGASGGMGTVLVQLAKAAGARVIGVARGDRKTALVRELGADVVVDAAGPDWVERAREALGRAGADVVLDGVGGEVGLAAFALVAQGGRFSAHGAPTGGFAQVDPADAAARGVRLLGIGDVQLTAPEHAELAGQALRTAAEGALRPVIGGTFPLERAASAHEAIESRELVGKAVLTV
ncbi:NADPH:quinone reductase-like Zn-dependent oxidoreductase [Streptomyces sp. 3211.6]|uniref:zinc-binding dehydrogenase n=1 Tax=Streptomyces sp. 3211.6 TaxID=1938845 RepID=UPI000C2CBFC6|nr:zinc-binding dehydrogenase [Streptomyces sp. 3211.6]RKT02793.1 NADPH:quinone reductase-like Zn-dependent oxidoreductase [Streptomyces sp. 3211.6]